MKMGITLLITAIFFYADTAAQSIRGIVKSSSGEELIGASIYIENHKSSETISGLDGTFTLKNIPRVPFTVICTYKGYRSEKIVIKEDAANDYLEINLHPHSVALDEVVVTINKPNNETQARNIEQSSMNVMNVVSAKAIEVSPDLIVSNVIQRVSGVTVERNNSGDGQYAILRGMDKRYNYTLVNGVKIPSPDNKNRFVPLDIFPAELLDRLEVSKSLIANMEGDGIGGAVNMVMKDAPSHRQVTANISTGYNALFLQRDFQYFNNSTINYQSPNERYGLAYPVKMKDFSSPNLHLQSKKAPLNAGLGVTYGDRFLKKKLGVIVAGSYMNNFRGNNNTLYGTVGSDNQQSLTQRYFSDDQRRYGVHAKMDYKLSDQHKIVWYNAYLNFNTQRVRDAENATSLNTRMQMNIQSILNSTLKGTHFFLNNKLKAEWSAVYSKAYNETPDDVQINSAVVNGLIRVAQTGGASRRWEHNSDEDKTGYLDFTYNLKKTNNTTIDLQAGGMYRDKHRSSFFNEYTFNPLDPGKPFETQRELIKGRDWNNFDEIKFEVKEYGNLSDPLNYDATEKIAAGYLQSKMEWQKIQLIAGVRIEHTLQGYFLKFPTEGARNRGEQNYTDVLPSLHLKYALQKNTNLRFSYDEAINRPSFFEIVPYQKIFEDYKERGNPDLKHTVAHNFDIRFEKFPRSSEQFMVGLFYKKIINPIEFTMISGFGQDVFYMPTNLGNVYNQGIEIDYTKYFNWIGFKANYTYTQSRITTAKKDELPNPDPNAENKFITVNVNQTRPLFGQAGHVINFSLLIKKQHGWDGQLSYSYTSDRIAIVSPYLNQDSWLGGYSQFDASIEKRFKNGLGTFLKASNLLNAPMIQYVKQNRKNESIQYVDKYKNGVVERKSYYGQNLTIGLRYQL